MSFFYSHTWLVNLAIVLACICVAVKALAVSGMPDSVFIAEMAEEKYPEKEAPEAGKADFAVSRSEGVSFSSRSSNPVAAPQEAAPLLDFFPSIPTPPPDRV